MIGFCVACAADVAIGPDRRCLTDSSLVLPPSTGCNHQRLINGSWSTCRCKPVAAGTWQKVLAPRDRPPEYQSTAVRRFSGATTLTTHESRRIAQARRQRSQRYPTPEIPCPVCSKPFSERLSAHGSMRKTCSSACGRVLRNRAVTASKQPARPPELTPSGREASQLVPSICATHRQEMRNGQPIRSFCRACDRKAGRREAQGVAA